MAVSSSSMRLNTNDKKEAAAKPIGSKKDKKKKKKKNRPSESSSPKPAYESINSNSFLMNPVDWVEASNDISFDDASSMVSRAVRDLYGSSVSSVNVPYKPSRYYVYKIWPDKVVVKRSYENDDTSDALFLMHPYVIKDDEAVLGDAEEVELGFLPADTSPDFVKAVREVDMASIDDPEFSLEPEDEEEADDDVDEEDDLDPDETEDEEDEEIDDSNDEDEDGDVEDVQEETTLREDINNLAVQDFTESFDSVVDNHARIIEGKNGFIIENMALLGAKSKNGRSYSKDVRIKAAKVFEGIKAYMNHPDSSKVDDPRRVQELIGKHRMVRYDESTDMLRSNLHLSPTHLVKEYLIPHAKANPGILGNSINASGKIDSKGNVLEVTKGRSVDVVAEPATTSGIFESVQGNKQKQNQKPEGGKKYMDVKEFLEDKENSGLVEGLREHFREELGVEEAVEELQNENQELKEQVAEFEMKEKKREEAASIEKLLKESKLDAEDYDDVRELLEEAKPERRPAIITRFEKLSEKAADKEPAAPSASREKNITEAVGSGKKPDATQLRAAMASGIRSRRGGF